MVNTAILVGNSQYKFLRELSCCHKDLEAMKELLEATKKYSEIEVIENTDADELKSRLRAAIDKNQPKKELFFYFTGHGCIHDGEYYHCATNFDSKRPNVTGLSLEELHTILKTANANLIVKLIDACQSGMPLVKTDDEALFQPQQKHGFENLIQICSSLRSQYSLTGQPISIFTEKFRVSVLRKEEGVVYYTDIISTLKDEFIQDEDQIPFFVSQGTGREQFVDDAKRLDDLRKKYTSQTGSLSQPESIDVQPLPAPPSLKIMLENAEKNIATPEKVTSFVNVLFDNLIQEISNNEFSEFFEFNIAEHSDFRELTSKGFIIRVLSRESRSDEFVTAKVSRKKVRNPLQTIGTAAYLAMFGHDQEYQDIYDLRLNCMMERVQLKITLTPKYHSLKQLVMVVTCAPSLENCYVFEIGTQHSLTDFGEFALEGDEIVRRWYKFHWTENTDGVVAEIVSKLKEIVQEHLDYVEQRLTKN